jgi:hypothetical protein
VSRKSRQPPWTGQRPDKKPEPAKRDPMARELEERLYRQRVVPDKRQKPFGGSIRDWRDEIEE